MQPQTISSCPATWDERLAPILLTPFVVERNKVSLELSLLFSRLNAPSSQSLIIRLLLQTLSQLLCLSLDVLLPEPPSTMSLFSTVGGLSIVGSGGDGAWEVLSAPLRPAFLPAALCCAWIHGFYAQVLPESKGGPVNKSSPLCRLKQGEQTARPGTMPRPALQCMCRLRFGVYGFLCPCPDPITT